MSGTGCTGLGSRFTELEAPEPGGSAQMGRFPSASYQVASLDPGVVTVEINESASRIQSEEQIRVASIGCVPLSTNPTRQFNRASLVADTVRGAIALGRLDRVNQAHVVSRHGPGTTLESQRIRAEKGLTPDGLQKFPVNATRFLTYRDQARAYRGAMLKWRASGMPTNTSFNFKAGSNAVAEGYYKGGTRYSQTNEVTVVFRNGKLYTLFGLLK
jgi:hypothetical protein